MRIGQHSCLEEVSEKLVAVRCRQTLGESAQQMVASACQSSRMYRLSSLGSSGDLQPTPPLGGAAAATAAASNAAAAAEAIVNRCSASRPRGVRRPPHGLVISPAHPGQSRETDVSTIGEPLAPMAFAIAMTAKSPQRPVRRSRTRGGVLHRDEDSQNHGEEESHGVASGAKSPLFGMRPSPLSVPGLLYSSPPESGRECRERSEPSRRSSSTTASSGTSSISKSEVGSVVGEHTRTWGGAGPIPFSSKDHRIHAEDIRYADIMQRRPGTFNAVFSSGNIAGLVATVLREGRPWWQVAHSDLLSGTSMFSMAWRQTAMGVRWDDLVEQSHLVNLFKACREITTKGSLMVNLSKYCAEKDVDLFSIIPVTFLLTDGDRGSDFKDFCDINAKYQASKLGDKIRLSTPNPIPFSGQAPKWQEERPWKASCFDLSIRKAFTNSGDMKNLWWILKPASLSRGRGITVVQSLEELKKHVGQTEKSSAQAVSMKWVWTERPEEAGEKWHREERRRASAGYASSSSDEEDESKCRHNPPSRQGSPMRHTDPDCRTNPEEGPLEDAQTLEEPAHESPKHRGRGYFRVRDRGAAQVSDWIVQKYMERPLLIEGRKFDIRMWVVVTPSLHVFCFREGYIRTAGVALSLDKSGMSDPFIHLTNNAIQKHGEEYGRHESGNQLSFEQLQNYLDSTGVGKGISVTEDFLPAMQNMMAMSLHAIVDHMKEKAATSFQLLGYDFMVDESMKVWLIEVNSNPCLEESSPLLQRLIPRMIQEMFILCVDPVFVPKSAAHVEQHKALMAQELHFDLICCLKTPDSGVEFPEKVDEKRKKRRSPSVGRGASVRSGGTKSPLRSSSTSKEARRRVPSSGGSRRESAAGPVSPAHRRSLVGCHSPTDGARVREFPPPEHRCPWCFPVSQIGPN